ncbi:hypothetical protein HGRIS_002745 [Hohenbuehelia grisea]|uniref:Uncharacterized protein n=1 Tax=Hohenbuehelia grisea TaxID=104357 RepID=A0ABR3JML1_9AGAR
MVPSALLIAIPFVVLASLFFAARNSHRVSVPAYTFLLLFVFASVFPAVFAFLHPTLPKAEHVALAILRAAFGAAVIYLIAPRKYILCVLAAFLLSDTVISIASAFVPVLPPLLAPHLDFLFPISTALVQMYYLIRTLFPSNIRSPEPHYPSEKVPASPRNQAASVHDIEAALTPAEHAQFPQDASFYAHTSRPGRPPRHHTLLLLAAQCAASAAAVLHLHNVTHTSASAAQRELVEYLALTLIVVCTACLTVALVCLRPTRSAPSQSRVSLAPSFTCRNASARASLKRASLVTMCPPHSPGSLHEKASPVMPATPELPVLARNSPGVHSSYAELPVPVVALPSLPSPTITISSVASSAFSTAPLVRTRHRTATKSQRFSQVLRLLFVRERSNVELSGGALEGAPNGTEQEGQLAATEDFMTLSDPFAPPPPKLPKIWTNVEPGIGIHQNVRHSKWAWGALPGHAKRKGASSPMLGSKPSTTPLPSACICSVPNSPRSPPSSFKFAPTAPLRKVAKGRRRGKSLGSGSEPPRHTNPRRCTCLKSASPIPEEGTGVGEDAMLAEMLLRRLTRDCEAAGNSNSNSNNGRATDSSVGGTD